MKACTQGPELVRVVVLGIAQVVLALGVAIAIVVMAFAQPDRVDRLLTMVAYVAAGVGLEATRRSKRRHDDGPS